VTKLAVKFLTIAVVIVELTNAGLAQEFDVGKFEYQAGCAACHGVDAKGMGPVAVLFRVPPSDLTLLAKKNNGVFPFNHVYEVIDGRKTIIAHGTRDMPIWGNRYLPNSNRALSSTASEQYVNPSYDPEIIVRMRILGVIDYLNRIQEK